MSDYQLYVSKALQEVEKIGNLLGKIEGHKYEDHNLIDKKKFPNLQPNLYLNMVHKAHGGDSMISLDWVENLQRATVVYLAHIPHFCHSP